MKLKVQFIRNPGWSLPIRPQSATANLTPRVARSHRRFAPSVSLRSFPRPPTSDPVQKESHLQY